MDKNYTFDSFYRMFKKTGICSCIEFVKANPQYKKMLTKAVAVAKAQYIA